MWLCRELEIRMSEERRLQSDTPETVDDFERLVRRSPNSSFFWLKFMEFMLTQSDVEQARSIAERYLTWNFMIIWRFIVEAIRFSCCNRWFKCLIIFLNGILLVYCASRVCLTLMHNTVPYHKVVAFGLPAFRCFFLKHVGKNYFFEIWPGSLQCRLKSCVTF